MDPPDGGQAGSLKGEIFMYIMGAAVSLPGGFTSLLTDMGNLLGTGIMLLGAGLFIFGLVSYFEAKAKEDTSKQNTAASMIFGGVVIAILGLLIQGNFLSWIQSVVGG